MARPYEAEQKRGKVIQRKLYSRVYTKITSLSIKNELRQPIRLWEEQSLAVTLGKWSPGVIRQQSPIATRRA